MSMDGMTLANLAKTETLSDRIAIEILSQLARRRQSQAGLARAMGVPQMWVSDRLSGKTQITVNDLAKVASTMSLTVADLLPRADREVTVTYPHAHDPAPVQPPRTVRPIGGRPPNRPATRRAPSGPGRATRVPLVIGA